MGIFQGFCMCGDGTVCSGKSEIELEKSQNTTMLSIMNTARVIQEIDSMTEQDQVKIAAQRLRDLEDGLEEEVPYEEAMTVLRSRL